MNLYDIVTPMTVDEAKATKQRLDPKCWTGYKKQGTKVKGGVRVNNCVPKESVEEDAWHAGDNAWSSENHEMVEGGQDFNKVEPYYVCIGGKPWKKFDYYEDARRAHDNLKKKWYKEGNPKYDTVTLMPVMDEAGSPAQQAAIAIAKKKEQGVEEGIFDRFKTPKQDPKADALRRELMLKDRETVPDMDDYSWQIGWHYGDGGKDVKSAYSDAYYDNPTIPSPPEPRSFKLGFDARKKQGVEEALSRKDLVKQIGDKLNDPEFRKKPADPNIRWERGDLYKGPGPGDYGYTGYQGHGMPTDKAERARIRADKKKGVAEGSTQEYTAKVIDSKNKSYTVKVSAPSEEGAKHMAVVKVRKEYGVKPEAVIIMNQGVAEGWLTPEWPDQRALPKAVAKLLLQYAKQNKKSIKQLIKLPPVNLVDVIDEVDPEFFEDNLEHLSDNDFNWVFSKATQKIAKALQQGIAEDVSRLTDAEYNQVAGYVRKKYPGAQLSGLGRNEDGSFNVMIDTGSGRHEFKVRFRDPEETNIGEGWKQKAAAVALSGAMAGAGGVTLNPNRIIDGQGRSAANPYGNVDSQGNVIKKPEAPKADAPKEKEKPKKEVKEDQTKFVRTHKPNCGWNYGHDCDCGGTLTHAKNCGHRFGHDCDCGLDKAKQQGVTEAGLGMWGDKGHNAKSQATKDLERSRNEKKQAADRARAEERDRAWWKAQDNAAKAGKDSFEFDGKTHPVKESYWTKLQNERNTKLNSLVNELKESVKK